ncbi:MAG TPA: hypothetical protein VFC46_02460, partial [Humisphaera sp.]|nr:hypothetical protein [Humisphaera sp.]
PLKAREYLAAGLPVVSTAIPEVRLLPNCRIAEDSDDFVEYIRAALADRGPSIQRSEPMRTESWEARLGDVCLAINELPNSPSHLRDRISVPSRQ